MPNLKHIFLFFVILLYVPMVAQQVNVDAKLDTNSMLIGDQVDFRLRLLIPENESFRWPKLNDTLPENIEIVKKSPIDTTLTGDGYMNVEQTLKLTVFDSGYYVIKPLEFYFGSDFNQSVSTEPYLLNVFTVEVDTTGAIKPIKGPIAAPLTFTEMLPWILLALAILLIGGLLIYYFSKKKKKEHVVFRRRKPKLPPYRIAFDELEKLKKEKLWQQDRVKEYHSRLTDILREYIEATYDIAAMEMTTWEIIRAFAGAKISQADLEKVREILELADFAKFAKLKPLPEENESSMQRAVEFVKNTMVKEETEAQKENNNGVKQPGVSEVN